MSAIHYTGIYRTRAKTPKPTAAAPVRALALVTSAAPEDLAAAAPVETELEEAEEADEAGEVAVGVAPALVSVTPTLLQMA